MDGLVLGTPRLCWRLGWREVRTRIGRWLLMTLIIDQKASLTSTAADACYYSAFAIYSCFHLLETTNYQTLFGISVDDVSTIATALMLVLLMPRLVAQFCSDSSFVKMGLILGMGLLVYIFTRSWIGLSVGLFICAGRGIRIDPLMWIMLVNAVLVFTIAYLGVYFDIIETSLTSRSGELRVRDSLGFAQVNSVGFIGARICTALAVLRRNKSPWLTVFVCIILTAFIEVVANSRTSEIYNIVLAISMLFMWLAKRRGGMKIRAILMLCATLVCMSFILTILALLFFNPSVGWEMSLSEALSNRIYSMWYIARTSSLTLFGNSRSVYSMDTVWTGHSYALLTIDNAWASWLVGNGFVPTLVLFIGVLLLFRQSRSVPAESVIPLVVLALLCSLFAFTETSVLSFDGNPLLVLLSCLIFRDSIEEMIRGKS